MDNVQDWAPARLRVILDKAKARVRVWRAIDLSAYDSELMGQDIQVWVNAPTALIEFIVEESLSDLASDAFLHAIAELTQWSADAWRDFLDTWDAALRRYVVRQVFFKIREYRDERFSFLISPPMDGTENNSAPSASETA